MQPNQEKQAGPEEGNLALSKVIGRNIHSLMHLRAKAVHDRNLEIEFGKESFL